MAFTIMPVAQGATPASGTLTDTSGPVTYTAGPFAVANPTPVPLVDSGPECENPVQPCDDFALTVSLPGDYAEQHPNDVVRFTAGWTDSGTGQSDYDLYVYKGTVTNTDGSEAAFAQSASGANPEITSIPVFDGTQTFTVKVVPFTPTAETVHVTIELATGSGGGGGGGGSTGFGGPTPTQPGVPRYQTLTPPPGSGANASSGEFNIGFNPKTGNIFTDSWGDVFRVTPPEKRTPALPEAGPALWEDVSPSISSATTLDPILVTDQSTGRTFISNLTTGANALFAFTDDDGATWTQASVAPPNGGIDHESLGVGPYPAPLAGLNPVYPNAVYYCSQANVPDMCQRSDSGGLEFGPGVPANSGLTGCGGLHGHIKVAPNGTVYLPGKDCGPSEGGAVSTDAGNTWSQFLVPNSGTSQSDPSIGIDKDNTAYYCYTPNDGSAHVAVSHDGGQTWTDDHDIGASVGVVQAVFPEAVAGDPGRAACGFLGTDRTGNFNSTSFPGRWYLFIATTYDGGKTWTTVNATPNDPVQGAGGICLSGLGCTGNNRNLLDFNEVTIDDRGRVLFGYDDGCVSDACLSSGGANNDFVAFERVARQTGGKPLYARFDPVEPTTPKAPYLDGTRDSSKAVLDWNAPDNGGSDFTAYRILRGTSPGSETQIATVSGDKTQYVDATVDASVPTYYYEVVAVNAQGDGPASNEVGLEVTISPPPPNPCEAPGTTIFSDDSGDSTTGTPGTDLRSLQLSQPYSSDGNLDLRFQLNTDPGTSPQPPGSYWYVSFKDPDGTVHGVRMWFDPSAPGVPTFQSYVAAGNTSGGVDGRFVESGTEKPADPSSFYDPSTGTIVIVVPAGDVGLSGGDTINGFNSASVQSVSSPAGGAAATVDEMPDGLGYQGSYAVKSNAACAPNTAPTAALTASPRSGNVPLQVTFDATGSSDPDQGDSVASYTFDFGDGSQVTQTSPIATHTYTDAGDFLARVTATDTHGATSVNDASVVIDVQPTVTCFEDDSANIAYDQGWHTIKDSDATAGHFRMSSGKGLSFTFQTSATSGTLTYRYGTSTKGGSADLYLDGSKVQSVSYSGSSGTEKAPTFGASATVPLSGSGTHTFALENAKGPDFVDQICVTDGTSRSQPSSAPGETTTSSQSVGRGGDLDSELFAPANAKSISVFAETSTSVPFLVAVLDPLGNVIHSARSSNGIASLDVPVDGLGLYTVQVVNLGIGPLSIWTAATPQLALG